MSNRISDIERDYNQAVLSFQIADEKCRNAQEELRVLQLHRQNAYDNVLRTNAQRDQTRRSEHNERVKHEQEEEREEPDMDDVVMGGTSPY